MEPNNSSCCNEYKNQNKRSLASMDRIPSKVKTLLFNCFIKLRRLPKNFAKSRTIFITIYDLISPADSRPISMTSATARHYHKILAHRHQVHYEFDARQRSFMPLDGTIDNLSILATVLADAKPRCVEVHIHHIIRLAKSFDSVYFEADTATY